MNIKQQIQEYLPNWEAKMGGSYIFEKWRTFRPDWLIGTHVQATRVFYNPPTAWMKVEFLVTGESAYEKFYEGRCESMDDLKMIFTLLGIEP